MNTKEQEVQAIIDEVNARQVKLDEFLAKKELETKFIIDNVNVKYARMGQSNRYFVKKLSWKFK